MIRLGIIGTGAIVEKFLRQAKTNKKVKITCMYSRSLSKAQAFAQKYDISHSTDNLATMLKYIDAVYIASPNGLHFSQSEFFLNHKIHVLVEKTMTFTVSEAQILINLARKNNLILLEAFISVHLPIFSKLKKLVQEVQPEVVNLQFNRASSRLLDIEQGNFLSVFDADLGKGATYDALVYPLQLALYLLGKVTSVKAQATKLANGTNLANYVILRHENNAITTITCSKGINSYAPSEFIGHDSSIILEQVHPLKGIKYYQNGNMKIINDDTNSDTLLTYELKDFVNMIIKKDYLSRDYWLNHSLRHLQVIAAINKSETEEGVKVIYEQ